MKSLFFANEIHFEMHWLYGDKCFTKPAIHVWCKNKLGGQKFTSDTEVQ